ncbi:melanoma-associated antigen 4-like [Octodon degus]|uniref:Melanoma-associated antigen 4-like n=1 Tax=Octodon degus TaxID=10160 RepID=A0A6P3FSE9_OCTDE|nr:melanoma-associated antigen 4-like [Octodon degus]
MPRGQWRRDKQLQRGSPAQSRKRIRRDAQVRKIEEKEAAASASSAFCFTYASMGATEEESGSETPGCPQNPQGMFPAPTVMSFDPRSPCKEGSGTQGEEGPSPSQGRGAPQITREEFINHNLGKFLPFLLLKFQNKELITLKEMVHAVDPAHREHCPLVFRGVCECMCMSFGVEMRPAENFSHSYELVPVLGLTYTGLLDNVVQAIPKAGLLIFILSAIIVKGERLREEDLKELLRSRQVLGEREHAVIGDPWKFITEDLVQAEYLVYQQVPNSDPACYEFLWGPRAHAETTQKKVLRHTFSMVRTDPRAFPRLQEQP